MPSRVGKELCSALGKSDAGIRGDQTNPFQATFLEMLEERAPARFVLLGTFADAKNLAIAIVIHANRNQQ